MSPPIKRTAFGSALALLLSGWAPLGLAAPAFVTGPFYARAFSPNGDGSRDSCPIEFLATGASAPLDLIQLGIYADTAVPPHPDSLRAAPPPLSLETQGLRTQAEYLWQGRAGDDGPGQALLPDGFYYLHILLREGADSLWLATPIQLELNTAGPTLAALALEPSPFFTPLQDGASPLLQLLFSSADFDTLTDGASASVHRADGAGGWLEVAELERDPDYFDVAGGLGRFRLLWDGRDAQELIVDGSYRLRLTLGDDAGNPAVTGSADCNLDARAPTIGLVDFGGPVAGGQSFILHPDSLPDSLVVQVSDRNGVALCVGFRDAAALSSEDSRLLPQSSPEAQFISFRLPEGWGEAGDPLDSHHFTIDAIDLPGNRKSALGGPFNLTLTLDGEAPPVPTLDPIAGEHIQPVVTLSGHCAEIAVGIELAQDGVLAGSAVTDIGGRFSLPVVLSPGSHVWTATAVDAAGNRSAPSTGLALRYTPGPALGIPGRLRGEADETIRINTRAPARSVSLRFYTLEGELLRQLDAQGGPDQFSARWDLRDAGGRAVMDGLCVLNLEIVYASGEREHERKVVAVVRSAP
ncbi:hypothetical protein FJ251_13690 [bacterium]|nr:hypothetical protein [bacterium]